MNNGVEVLADDDDEEMREHALSLIEMSGKQASAKLQFARLAYGASSTAGESMDLGEIRQVLEILFDGGKIAVEWENFCQRAQSRYGKNFGKLNSHCGRLYSPRWCFDN